MKQGDVTSETMEKMRGKGPQGILEIAQAEGVELTDGQLEAVSGGKWNDPEDLLIVDCPKCSYQGAFMPGEELPMNCPNCGEPFKWATPE